MNAKYKYLFALCFTAVLIGSFLGSVWYHRGGGGNKEAEQAARKVLYYVDPMNPGHTSDSPGLAPCGMPMEPVYAEDETSGTATFARYMPPGTVRISPEKQQMIGVRVERVETAAHEQVLRALGRVAADENLAYRVIANIEGWAQEIQGSTTGSLVQKDQVLALINSYSVDFYTWQWQYITYTAYQRPAGAQVPKTRLPMVQQPEAMQPEHPPVESLQAEGHAHGSSPGDMDSRDGPVQVMEQAEVMPPGPEHPAARLPRARFPGAQRAPAASGGLSSDHAPQGDAPGASPRAPYTKPSSASSYSLVDSNLYKSKLALLNIGLREEQLEQLARTGQYQTHLEVRSPVRGFVLTRSLSPWQRIEKGNELYRIADLSRVWVLADVFEREAAFIRPGTTARVTIPHQGTSFVARVTDVLPQFDTATRTLKVRLEVENPDFVLIPDMFVDVEFAISLPPAITVPVDAVLDSGVKKTAFVDLGNGYFEARSVGTGWRYGGRLEIVEGIMPGESVVVSGNFLVDSESRMKLAAAGLRGTLSKDPTCEMEVYTDKARKEGLIRNFEGKTYYFCSKECQAMFNEQHGARTAEPAAAQQPGGLARSAPPAMAGEQPMDGFWRDPVCGTLLPDPRAKQLGFKSEYRGKTYYFCSESCRKQFEGSQERYLDQAAAAKESERAPGRGGHRHD